MSKRIDVAEFRAKAERHKTAAMDSRDLLAFVALAEAARTHRHVWPWGGRRCPICLALTRFDFEAVARGIAGSSVQAEASGVGNEPAPRAATKVDA